MNASELASRIRTGVNKKIGEGAIFQASESTTLEQVEGWIPMPDFVNKATGGQGIPCGHLTGVVGDSDTGKTTLVMIAMKNCQQDGGLVYLLDSEHKFSFERFATMGGDPEGVEILQAESLEEAWNKLDVLFLELSELREKVGSEEMPKVLIVWDSIAASIPDSIITADAEDFHVAVEAKLNNKQVRKLRQTVKRNNIAFLYINHTYMSMPKFGIAKEIMKGGSELFYMSTLILKTQRKSWLQRTVDKIEQKFGMETILKVFKGHFHGRKNDIPFYIVDRAVFTTKDELDVYKESIKGEL